MALDIGYIHCGGDSLYVRVFYQQGFVPGAGQTYADAPLVNNADPTLGPTGFCLLVVNTTGERGSASVWGADGALLVDHVRVPTGDPVTSGAARSRTTAQVAALGWSSRGDVGTITVE